MNISDKEANELGKKIGDLPPSQLFIVIAAIIGGRKPDVATDRLIQFAQLISAEARGAIQNGHKQMQG